MKKQRYAAKMYAARKYLIYAFHRIKLKFPNSTEISSICIRYIVQISNVIVC